MWVRAGRLLGVEAGDVADVVLDGEVAGVEAVHLCLGRVAEIAGLRLVHALADRRLADLGSRRDRPDAAVTWDPGLGSHHQPSLPLVEMREQHLKLHRELVTDRLRDAHTKPTSRTTGGNSLILCEPLAGNVDLHSQNAMAIVRKSTRDHSRGPRAPGQTDPNNAPAERLLFMSSGGWPAERGRTHVYGRPIEFDEKHYANQATANR
jgi:hypothetical protein